LTFKNLFLPNSKKIKECKGKEMLWKLNDYKRFSAVKSLQ